MRRETLLRLGGPNTTVRPLGGPYVRPRGDGASLRPRGGASERPTGGLQLSSAGTEGHTSRDRITDY